MHQKKVPMPSLPLSIDVEYKAKSSFPIIPSESPEGAIGEDILPPTYSNEQHETWQKLFSKQSMLIKKNHYLCDEYMIGLEKLNFPSDRIPNLSETSAKLQQATGWQCIRVCGLVPPEKFFALLANKIFPCTDFIRHQDELDYTPAPDLFHDQVGHLPMIAHPQFAEFFQLFGLAGCATRNEEEIMWFNRIYWFTTEFGLIARKSSSQISHTQIYGAGIASSCGEIMNCLSDKVKRRPFDIHEVAQTDFDIFRMQDFLFEINSFEDLEKTFRQWAIEKNFL